METNDLPTVLVVADDSDTAGDLHGWLADRFDVLGCPGPGAPDYTCLGGRGIACPLADCADVVVLDLRLASDEVMRGVPGWQLLMYYLSLKKPVVALVGPEDPVRPLDDDGVATIPRPPSREALVAAVARLAART